MIDNTITEKKIQDFFTLSSFAGLLALYALKLSYEKKIAFDKNDFASQAYVTTADYFFGFVVACTALGIVSHNLKGNVITVTEIHPLISKHIEDAIIKNLEKNEKRPGYWENVKKFFS